MPTYEYSCRDCGQHLEVVQSFRDDALTVCGSCSGTLRKVFSPAGIIFKGSGYYTTDTRAEREQARNGSSKSAGSDSKSEGASDSGGSDTNSGDDAKGSADTKDAKSDSSSESGSKSGSKSKSADSGSESAA